MIWSSYFDHGNHVSSSLHNHRTLRSLLFHGVVTESYAIFLLQLIGLAHVGRIRRIMHRKYFVATLALSLLLLFAGDGFTFGNPRLSFEDEALTARVDK